MTMLTNYLYRACGLQRVTVPENERFLVLAQGRFRGMYGPGRHWLPAEDCIVEKHRLSDPLFTSPYSRALERERPDIVAAHLTVLQAEAGQALVAMRDGVVVGVSLGPHDRKLLWTDAGPWTVQAFPIPETLAVPELLRPSMLLTPPRSAVRGVAVGPGEAGVLMVDGAFQGVLGPGAHLFWNTGAALAVKTVDMRARVHEATGQEVLTADKVTIRVNITAAFKVVDARTAVMEVDDYEQALHRALQLAFRKTVGQRTLDQMLAERTTVDAEAAEQVRVAMREIGLEVGEIALKDVILPGEMREILNQVVQAEKAAEANVIRRREETAATRALLNTAKVMADNPVMLRLKELEALTEIAGKVERLTVHNGASGLMNDLVKQGR